jgi:hypothetical protein
MNELTFNLVQVFLSCVHATLFTAQLPWKNSGTLKNLSFALIHFCIALVVSIAPSFYALVSASLVAIAIPAAGIWLRREKNTPCDCFGVLNDDLGKRSNSIGIVLIAAHGLLLACAASLAGAGQRLLPSIPAPVSVGVLLFLAALVFARVRQSTTVMSAHAARPGQVAGYNPDQAATVTVPADMVLGHDAQRSPVTLAGVRPAHSPLGFLIVADGCPPCRELKRDIAALRRFAQLPIWSIAGNPGAPSEPYALHDHDQTLRQLAGAKGTPCLLVIEAGDDVITRTIYGLEYIRSALIELIVKDQVAADASERLAHDSLERFA